LSQLVTTHDILRASSTLSSILEPTPLQYSKRLSEKYSAHIYLKREDLQEVRSFKIRGAYNKMASLSPQEAERGVVCASAGNHAQGVAYSCNKLGIQGVIYMPLGTPNQKIRKVRHFGGKMTEVRLQGQNFDEAKEESLKFSEAKNYTYVHPFDDALTIAGQGTIAKEILEQGNFIPDAIVASIGGGGLMAGLSIYIKSISAKTRMIGVESEGQASMQASIKAGKLVTLAEVNTFAEGTAVKTPGKLTFSLCQNLLDDIKVVEIGHICSEMIDLYQNEGVIAEPSGALPLAALEQVRAEIKGKHVVCVICGGNNDILRYPEIMEKSLLWQGLKHYFIVNFSQRPGELKRLVNNVLTNSEDIVLFEYLKRSNKEKGPALVGIELYQKEDLAGLLKRFEASQIEFEKINPDDSYYSLLL
jgi:threonine dehydratase